MVAVQVADEDLVHPPVADARRRVVGAHPGAAVEHELVERPLGVLVPPDLDEQAHLLRRPAHRRDVRAHEGDAHLVLLELLADHVAGRVVPPHLDLRQVVHVGVLLRGLERVRRLVALQARGAGQRRLLSLAAARRPRGRQPAERHPRQLQCVASGQRGHDALPFTKRLPPGRSAPGESRESSAIARGATLSVRYSRGAETVPAPRLSLARRRGRPRVEEAGRLLPVSSCRSGPRGGRTRSPGRAPRGAGGPRSRPCGT